MNRMVSTAVTGVALGMAAGAAAYMMSGSKSMKAKTKRLKKNAGRAIRGVGELIDNVSYMIK